MCRKRSTGVSLLSLFATLSEDQNISPFFSTVCALFAQNCRGVPPLFLLRRLGLHRRHALFAKTTGVYLRARPACVSLGSTNSSKPVALPLTGRTREHSGTAVRRFRWVDESREGCVMNRIAKALRVGLSLLGLAVFGSVAGAQDVPPLDKIQSQAELDKAIATLDAALFDSYNKCDLEKFASYFTENVEFYHDQGGLTLGRAALTESVKKNICGKVTRELVPGTLQVFYMKGYGAIEMGVHRFHHPGHEDTEGVGEGRFVHLWQYKDGAWKITRVLSYDHHAAPK